MRNANADPNSKPTALRALTPLAAPQDSFICPTQVYEACPFPSFNLEWQRLETQLIAPRLMFYRERLRLFFGLISGLEFVSRVGHGHPFVVQCKVHLYSFVYDN